MLREDVLLLAVDDQAGQRWQAFEAVGEAVDEVENVHLPPDSGTVPGGVAQRGKAEEVNGAMGELGKDRVGEAEDGERR